MYNKKLQKLQRYSVTLFSRRLGSFQAKSSMRKGAQEVVEVQMYLQDVAGQQYRSWQYAAGQQSTSWKTMMPNYYKDVRLCISEEANEEYVAMKPATILAAEHCFNLHH